MKLIKNLLTATVLSSFVAVSGFASDAELIKKGEKIYTTNTLGNCIACHAANGKTLDGPGSMGPVLQYLSAWPDEALYDKIYDPNTANPISVMPAFGKNGWLSDDEIKAVVAYLKTIN
ncbi:sulfur oxidation c-type cytochrome SoxX [Arcobacter aquimarinus]|uniref:Sulfur oxidation protein SoxXA, monoheme cytochrome c subunit n=1 Tax=Arcobacter aquimarinus TaxID=1315211 RepID=A0AAE7B126_9BACT|nr:sulfur oxidation c-type cytochrome SoxX [Arcobacter aquimarinus]QKE25379.1 sulfur oxidation protein SoxXA, monoheme cytochrome c subunit [Arcobacter aquimarinus]RXI31789.1 sulfur oxidation c-type cytochrome SoxX [Arcobacter aquimarinus]